MITRYYICDNCSHSFDTKQALHDKLLKKCPSCGKHKLYQDLQGQHSYVRNVNTLGQLADRNTKKMGRYEREARVRQDTQEAINRKYLPVVEQGLLTPDQVPTVDKVQEGSPFGEIPKEKKKKIFKGTKKEQLKKIDDYIRNG